MSKNKQKGGNNAVVLTYVPACEEMNELNLTKLVELYYSNTPHNLLVNNLSDHSNLTMRDLMDDGAHKIEDMLVDCKWAGGEKSSVRQ